MLTITTYLGTPLEERGRDQLQRLLSTYDLARWLFTREVLIRSYINPHSHPVLTVNTRQIDNDDGCLGTFLHEQFHWYAAARTEQTESAINDFRELYPVVPSGLPEGAQSERSTYLHLIICTLEHDALRQLIGADRARKQITDRPYYSWVYQQVLSNSDSIRGVLERHQLTLP